MPASFVKIILLSVIFAASPMQIVLAQDSSAEAAPETSRIKRVVESVPYWVESDQLRIRNNPYAGDVIGMLKIGQKIKAHKTVDNWVLISEEGEPEQWVNKNFLSYSPVTWANYSFDSRNAKNLNQSRFRGAGYDVNLKRIKVKDQKNVKIYAADIKRLGGGKKLVISRHNFQAGPYFEKRLIQCDARDATHVKFLGEGYTVTMMEADPRKEQVGLPMTAEEQIQSDELNSTDRAIADYACETGKL